MFCGLFVHGHNFVNADLYKFALPNHSFKKLVFRLSMFCIFCMFCFQIDVMFIDLKHLSNQCLCSQVLCVCVFTLYKLLVKTKNIVLEKAYFQRGFEFFKYISYVKKRSTENLASMIYESFILELFWSFLKSLVSKSTRT